MADWESALPPAITPPELSQMNPPTHNAAAAGAGPGLGLVGEALDSVGNFQSRRRAGIRTCKRRKATTINRNATAPLGQRKAAQASNVHPSNPPIDLNPARDVIPTNPHTSSASNAG